MVKAMSMAANLIAAATAADRPHDTCIGIFANVSKTDSLDYNDQNRRIAQRAFRYEGNDFIC